MTQVELPDVKTIMSKVKNTLYRFKNGLDIELNRISEFKDSNRNYP